MDHSPPRGRAIARFRPEVQEAVPRIADAGNVNCQKRFVLRASPGFPTSGRAPLLGSGPQGSMLRLPFVGATTRGGQGHEQEKTQPSSYPLQHLLP